MNNFTNKETIKALKLVRYTIKKKENAIFFDHSNYIKPVRNILEYNNIYRTNHWEFANLIWRSIPLVERVKFIPTWTRHQRFAHWIYNGNLGKKDSLYRSYWKLRNKFPEDIAFMPESYVIPYNKEEFLNRIGDYQLKNDYLWLWKPVNSSRGRGIYFMKNKNDIPNEMIATRYIHNPYWINNTRFHLRVYILIMGYSPMKLYMYNQGFCRFSDEPFDINNLDNLKAHLTNYDYNHDAVKWNFTVFNDYLRNKGDDVDLLWTRIRDILVKIMLSVTDDSVQTTENFDLPSSSNLFEWYGADVIIDNTWTPWLWELNYLPDWNNNNEDNLKITTELVRDMINWVGVIPFNHETDKSVENECKYSSTIERSIDESRREFGRYSGGWDRLFPLKENIDKYSKFLERPGKDNLAWWNYIKAN